MKPKNRGESMDWISDWAEGIIIAVIIGTVIEMILPEGNSKKYIKMVIGIYVLFTIVSPIITKFTGESIQVSEVLELDKYIVEAEEAAKAQNTIQNDNQDNIMKVYLSGIKSDMKAKIEAKGYNVKSIDVGVTDDETYKIQYINLSVEENENISNPEENSGEDNEQNIIENTIEPVEQVEKVEVNIGSEKTDTEEKSEEDNDNKSQLSYSKKQELKEYLSSVYEVNVSSITIN